MAQLEREDKECAKLRQEIEALKNLFVEVKPASSNLKETNGDKQ